MFSRRIFFFVAECIWKAPSRAKFNRNQIYRGKHTRKSYGARYLDPKYSRWISTDPALGEYIPAAGKANAKDMANLPGMGGIFNHTNAGLFHYAGNCPVRYIDPDGRKIVIDKSYGEDFENDVKESLKYLMKSERGKMIIKKLQESPHQFTIKKCNWLNFDDTSMCVDGDTIYWSPKHTLEASNGEYNSPAIILIHELTHAWVKKTDTGRKAYNNFYNTNKEKLNKLGYDKPTEEFATAIELVVAKELKEPSGRKFYNDVQRVDGYVVIVTLPKNMPLAHSQYWSK